MPQPGLTGPDQPEVDQPDPDASSDGDGTWVDDPAAGVDPDEDRSVDAVIERTAHRPPFDEEHGG